MAQRDVHKAAPKSQASEDSAGIMFHDSMQYAVKILMNTFYGVFAVASIEHPSRLGLVNYRLGVSISKTSSLN